MQLFVNLFQLESQLALQCFYFVFSPVFKTLIGIDSQFYCVEVDHDLSERPLLLLNTVVQTYIRDSVEQCEIP